MQSRVKTNVKSPYVGLFQYPEAGPGFLREHDPTRLPSDIPYIGTFRHNFASFPWVLPSYLKTKKTDASTQTEYQSSYKETQTLTRPTDHKSIQATVDLNTFVIVNYSDSEYKKRSSTGEHE